MSCAYLSLTGSRWHLWAFTTKDVGSVAYIRQLGGATVGLYSVYIDGVVRTVFDEAQLAATGTTTPPAAGEEIGFTICSVAEEVNGPLSLGPAPMGMMEPDEAMAMCAMAVATVTNPPIRLEILDRGITHDFAPEDASVTPVTNVPNAVVLDERHATCMLTAAARTDAFMRYNGTIYRHDPRVRLLENSLGIHGDVSSPWATEELHDAGLGASCPVVSKVTNPKIPTP